MESQIECKITYGIKCNDEYVLEKKLESIEKYEKRFLNSLKNLNSISLLKSDIKQELQRSKTNKIDLNTPKFLFQNESNNHVQNSSHKSRYDRIRSKSSHARHKSAKNHREQQDNTNLNQIESKSLNLLTSIKRSHSTNSSINNLTPMSSSNSLNSNWYKPRPLQKPLGDDSIKKELNETKMDCEQKLESSEEYDNLLNQSIEVPDYQQKSNVQSFIILNDSTNSYNDQASHLQQVSEEYDDEEDDNELRTYDDDYNINNFHNSEDEFFLISSPSPFANEDTEPTIRQNALRYEQNRLSNIIEEDDESNNMSEHEDFKQMLELSKEVTDSYKNIENELNYRPVVKKRVYNLNRTYYEKTNDSEEEPDSILNYLIDRLTEQHKLDLSKLETSNRYEKMEQDLINKYSLPDENTGFFLTKSLYAQNKVINENNKLITALSINEIETRKSVCLNETDSDIDEENDEKKIKEEIVLIGEKTDIDSLLHNENNQLYNLLVANTNRCSQLSNLESDLNKKRLDSLKEIKTIQTPTSEDVEIEIQVGETDSEQEVKETYEEELRDVAKYLVDEITKISLNKVKIDYLNEKYENKSFDVTNLIDREINEPENPRDDKQDLIEYYENLEKNLHQVRSEIDKLKKEAVEDLAYLSKILNTDELDIDEYYLNNDDAISNKTETETEYLSQSSNLNQEASSQVYLTPAESFNNHNENTLTNQTDAESENEETKITIKEIELEEEDENTLKNEIEDLSHLVKNILTSRPSFKLEKLESKFEPSKRQTLHLVDKKSVENLLKLASNSASLLNLHQDIPIEKPVEKPIVKPRKKTFENQLTSLISSAKTSSSNFRVPSSRHFCGRLMSVSQNSVSSPSCSSSSSSASMTNTNEEISIETDSTESPSPISSSPNSQYNHQRNMAKSVEFLGTKIDDLKKEKSLINLISEPHMSKSIKDLREFVSSSYSPSQIVRPELVQKKATVVTPNLDKPLKNEKSDQIRLEYLQQEQMLAKLNKQKALKKNLENHKQQEYYRKADSDDALINCILEMKPLPANRTNENYPRRQPLPQPRNQPQMYKNNSVSSYSLSSGSQTNSNRNSINQNENLNKKDAYLNNQLMNKPNLNNTNRPLLSTSNINRIYANQSPSNLLPEKSPQYITRNSQISNRTISTDALSASSNSFNQQRVRPYMTHSNTNLIADNRGRIKKETNL